MEHRSAARHRCLLLGAALLLASASQGREPEGRHLARIEARGKLTMLCFAKMDSYFARPDLDAMRTLGIPLAELRDPDHFDGLDIDLIRAFAEFLGVELEVRSVTTSYQDLLEALVRGEGDLVASSVTITEERDRIVDFSTPYLRNFVAVAVPEDSPISSLSDLEGRRTALMRGSSQLEYVQGLGLDIEIHLNDYTLENYIAVTEGEVDFTVIDTAAPVGQPVSDEYPELRVAFRLREFGYGVAVPEGSDLVGPLNDFIATIDRSGLVDRLLKRHRP